LEPSRVLIVEPDASFALSLASLFQDDGCATSVARTAEEAEREIGLRRPSLMLLRAELPGVSGFSLCARFRRSPASAGVPIIVLSSDASPEALAEHARTQGAADAYLAMPLDTSALTAAARRLMEAGTAELADDAVVDEGAAAVEVPIGRPPAAASQVDPAPPPVPQRPQRQSLTDEDRLFLDRTFRSLADRRQALIAESYRRRPPPRRDLRGSPEGRMALLREELKEREAQIARLSELWEVREREVASVGERVHRKDVEMQAQKLQQEDLARKLAAARELFLQREREHGASLQDLLLERFGQEKELIEVVASSERRIHELQRELRLRDDDLARRKLALESAAEEMARLERRLAEEGARADEREAELARQLARRDEDLLAAGRELAEARAALEAAGREREEILAASRAAAEVFQARVEEREAALREREERLGREQEERRRLEERLRRREEELLRERAGREPAPGPGAGALPAPGEASSEAGPAAAAPPASGEAATGSDGRGGAG
jgi:ParB family chromosome partitioning protein